MIIFPTLVYVVWLKKLLHASVLEFVAIYGAVLKQDCLWECSRSFSNFCVWFGLVWCVFLVDFFGFFLISDFCELGFLEKLHSSA